MITSKDVDKFNWYQTIEFEPGITSSGCAWCGDPLWPLIHSWTGSLSMKRVLDLGSNAGIFCVRSALDGASECIGIESNSWKPYDDYLKQAKFVKEYFESKVERLLPIRYINGNMEDVLDNDFGYFDWCFAIASLYYSHDQPKVVDKLYKIAKNVIARLRDDSKIEYITALFEGTGFKLEKSIKEDWSHLKIKTDEFYLFHYVS